MSRNRLENLDRARQERLFESAADEFAARGYDGASLNRILERSGMSKSSLYYYFDDKADLFTTMIDRAFDFLLKEIGGFDVAQLTAETYWDEIDGFYRRGIEVASKRGWMIKFGRLFYGLRNNPKAEGPVGLVNTAIQRWIDEALAKGQGFGLVRSDLPQTMLIDAVMGMGMALDHWMVAHWEEMSPDMRVLVSKQQMDLIRRVVAP